MSKVGRWTPSAIWSTVILVATSIPGSMLRGAPVVAGADKGVHALLYGTLGFLVWRAVASGGGGSGRRAGIALAAIALCAVLDEWHQQFIPGRSTDMADWMADVAGAIVGLTLSRTAPWRRGSAS